MTLAALLLGNVPGAVAAEPAAPEETVEGEATNDEAIISLAAYNVRADFIEDFGVRVQSETYSGKAVNGATFWFATYAPRISAVLPNTAAARAGLRPGERVLKSEGKSTVGGLFSSGKLGQWHKVQKKKWAEVAAGKKNVTWTLEVESPGTKAVRTVKLVVPTPPPHWGSSVWHAPAGRSPGVVAESGPLAECSRAILDQGIWSLVDSGFAGPGLREKFFGQKIPADEAPTGYTWRVGSGQEGEHHILVAQFRGRTDILLQVRRWPYLRIYLTSPAGVLEKAWRPGETKLINVGTPLLEIPVAEARAGFEQEVDLWANQVVRGTGRWPFAVKPGYDLQARLDALASKEGKTKPAKARPRAAEFLKLRVATEAERELFAEAYGKLGAESERWAYTETVREPEDERVWVRRVDPSQTGDMRCVLLSIDGRAPTADETQEWRDGGGEVVKPLGELLALESVVDFKDVRVVEETAEAVGFELPLTGDNADFPTEKFQARFRVNKATRALESVVVSLRDSFRVAGVVKVTEGGLELRLETLEPGSAPQPVLIKLGGAARVLLVKIGRGYEATRTDFRRVEPVSN